MFLPINKTFLQYCHSRPNEGAVGACEEIRRGPRRHHQNSVAILARCIAGHCSPSSGAFALRRQREHGQGIHEVLLVPAGHHPRDHVRLDLLPVGGLGGRRMWASTTARPCPRSLGRAVVATSSSSRWALSGETNETSLSSGTFCERIPKGLATVDFSDNSCLFRFREPSAHVAEKVSEKVTDECYYYCHRCYYY